jgi:hypothetical protein
MTTNRNKMANQRAQLLERLRAGPLSSDEARQMGITAPSARVFELRHDLNVNIATVSTGKNALYVLMPDAFGAA